MSDLRIRRARPDEHEAVLDLIAAEQSDLARACCYVGTERAGIAAELDDLDVDWRDTLLVAETEGRVTGAVLADYDTDLGRSWIHGPWVPGAWAGPARALVEAMVAALPQGITDHEISADVAHTAMAALAADLGWPASEPNHVYVADAGIASAWPADDPRVREPRADDLPDLQPLHDQEFPATYYPARRLLEGAASGEFLVGVADDGEFLGYAAGRIQADGEGYLDFVAVPDAARGRGAGRALVVTVGRRIIAASPRGTLNLTVQDHRVPAQRLYEALGFRREASIVGYRTRG